MRRAFIGSQATRFSIILLLALLFAGAIAGTTWSLARAQASNGVYDTDGDKLIEIQYLEQLDAIRYDPNGDGAADVTGDAASYAAAFPVNTGESVCIEGCNGYELSNSLDFKDAGSYRSGSVNTAWTSTAGDGWTPIIHVDAEGAKKGYRAFFDGNNHTIANLYSRGTTSPNRATGLFGALEWVSGEIRYLGLTGVKIVGGYANTGALVASNKGNVVLSYATGTVSGKGNVGGLVGNNGNTGTVAGSYSSASVSSSENYVGGLVGDNLGNITHSHATGAVSGSKNYVGGLVGYSVGPVNHSYASGNITGKGDVGGLIGKNAGLVARTYTTGIVSATSNAGATSNYFGGLAGNNIGTILVSYATSSVTAASSDNVGGLAGRNGGTVRAVYATGAVSGNASVGGLIGSNTEKVQYAFSTGSVTGQSAVSSGGLIGANAATESTITDSYWDTTTGPATSAAGTGKTTTELQTPTSNTGIYAYWQSGPERAVWDFGTSSQYPALKADLNNDNVETVGEFGNQRSGAQTPASTPTPTPTPTVTPTPTPTATPTPTPTPTATPTPTPTPTPGP